DDRQAQISDEISLGDDASFEIDLSALENSELESKSAQTTSLELEDSAGTLADFEMSDAPVAFSKYQADDAAEMGSDMDADVAALAAQLDEFEKNDNRAVAKNMDFGMLDDEPKRGEAKRVEPSLELASDKPAPALEPKTETKPAAKEPRSFDLSGLSLLDLDAEIPAQAPVEPAKPATAPVFKKSSLSLEAMEGDAPAEKPLSSVGAVLILAGMGGPDAVRQLLKALPTSLNVPVLLYQHLEVGKHDRLVAQLEKVSNMPVYLAVQGQSAEPGQVAVIPVGIGLDLVGEELFFGGAESQQALVESLPAKHSVVVVLSGAAAETAGAAANVQSQGGLALAQDPGNCFEPAAAEALIKQGGKTAEISALAS
ncbi:MAG: chemotaxis protein CheB, partial [Arenimonas sp.]